MSEEAKQAKSRRAFLGAAASTAFAFTIVPGRVFGKDAPSNKLNIAVIGVGGRGRRDLAGVASENIVAVCDVDLARAKDGIEKNPQAKLFRDFRIMLDEMQKDIDAVVVATPDHTHYVAAMEAIGRGKHVYCEKPLAHSVDEVRRLTQAARKYKVATQMGNQGHSSEDIRLCHEAVRSGVIGAVREVHAWSNRPLGGYPFPVAMSRPSDTPRVPKTLDWDLWLGPAQNRPYHPSYVPIKWRGWLDFGTGALGDMGCHILDPAFWALKLDSPTSVEANTTHVDPKVANETFPIASIVRYEFPARGDMPPLKLTWYDGGMLPPRPKTLPNDAGFAKGNGAFLVGETGVIMHGSHGAGGCRVLPDLQLRKQQVAPKTIARVDGHHQDWINACKGGRPASSNFDYGGPLTEMVLLGVIAMRIKEKKLQWDAEEMRFTNSTQANDLLKPVYRDGWTL